MNALKQLITGILLTSLSMSLHAQSNSNKKRPAKEIDLLPGVPVIEVIESIRKTHNIVFSYSPESLSDVNVHNKYIFNQSLSVDSVLSLLNQETAFKFDRANDKNVIVSPKNPGNNILVRMQIFDDASGEPLIGTTVFTKSKSASALTDQNGRFEIYSNLTDKDTIIIKYIGYETIQIPVADYNKYPGRYIAPVSLEESSEAIDEVVVEAYLTSGIDFDFRDQSIRIRPNEAGLLPGETETDVLTSLDALPGISSPDGKAGNLIVRGSFADQTMITFDDIPIYHKGHYFGTLSPYNAHVTEEIRVQRNGAQGAEKGGRVGGLIEIKSIQDIPDSAQLGIGIATSYISAYANIPLVKNKLSMLLGFRSSHPLTWNTPRIQAISDFIFQISEIEQARKEPDIDLTNLELQFGDANAKFIYKINKKTKLGLSLMGISNYMHTEINRQTPLQQRLDTVTLDNYGASLNLESSFSSKVSFHSSLTASNYKTQFVGWLNDPMKSSNQLFLNQLVDFAAKADVRYKPARDHTIRIGGFARNHEVNSIFDRPVNQDSSVRATVNALQYEEGGYLRYDLSGDHNINLSTGLRANYFTGTKTVYLEPRFALNYFVTDAWTAKVNAGRYNQMVHQVGGLSFSSIGGVESLNWNLSNNNDLPVVQSNQMMVGAIYAENNLIIDIEGYYKYTKNISMFDFRTNPDKTFLHGNMESTGIDILVKKRYKKLEAWMSYSYSISELYFPDVQSEWFDNVWNQEHMFNIVSDYSYKNLKVSVGWKFKSGLAALPTIRTNFLSGVTAPLTAPPGQQVVIVNPQDEYVDDFPYHHQLDASFSYQFSGNATTWKGNIGLSLQNIYNRRILLDQVYRRLLPGEYIVHNVYGLGFTPALMVNLSF